MMKKILTLTGMAVFGAMVLSGCDEADAPLGNIQTEEAAENLGAQANDANDANDADAAAPANPPGAAEQPADDEMNLDGTMLERLREGPAQMLQLRPVAAGEELAVIHTSMGDITLRFFPDEAPLAVENFLTHARSGYYDGITFHRVFPNFMIQGGCPLGTGTGGASIWGDTFDLEFSFHLRHFRGALAMAHAGGHMGSQFYIVQNPALDVHSMAMFQELLDYQDELIGAFSDGTRIYLRDIHPEDGLHYWMAGGGTPHLDWFWSQGVAHPVFGHVVDGMDVVDAIANVSANAQGFPDSPVTIERISFVIYE